MQNKKGEEVKFKGRSQVYGEMLSGIVVVLVGFTRRLLSSYHEELLPEVDWLCFCHSWLSFQKTGLSQKLPVQ